MATVERNAKLFEAGDYPDKDCSFTEADLDTIIANTPAEVPVKIEHTDTPFDGFLGHVKSLVRKGSELWGRVSLPAELWALLDKSGARKLSVGINRNPLALYETSIVRNPRVASARIFSDRLIYTGRMEMDWGGMSESELRCEIEEALNLGMCGCWIEEMMQDSVIVSDGMDYQMYPFTVVDGEMQMGDPVEVRKTYTPKTEPPMTASDTTKRGTTMADSTNLQMTQEQLDAKLQEVKQSATADAMALFTKELEKRDEAHRRETATIRAKALLDTGKIEEGQLANATTVLLSDAADAFAAFVDGLPGKADKSAKAGPSEDAIEHVFSALGLTEAERQKARGK